MEILYALRAPLYRLHYRLVKVVPRDTKHYVSICCIFKNEAMYLKEWVEYHRLIGIDHIYAYNNFSTDDYLEVLQPYMDEGYVTLHEWPVPSGQIEAYTDCLERYRNETTWIAYIDIDEFICPLVHDDVKEWIRPFEAYPTVEMHWKTFGTSGHQHKDPDALVIERFTSCWEQLLEKGKIFLNTRVSPAGRLHHHHMCCWDHFLGRDWRVPTVDENGDFFYRTRMIPYTKKVTIQLNHYWSKSLEEYQDKIDRGDAFSLEEARLKRAKSMAKFKEKEAMSTSTDFSIQRFIDPLKQRMGR